VTTNRRIPLTPPQIAGLQDLALAVRAHCVRMAGGGGCFLGASLSCADLVVYLYQHVLRVDPKHPDRPDRDWFLLSKGHDVPALYGTLAEMGFFPRSRLERHLSPEDCIYWHPNRGVPGIEYHSGSLGHLLAVGAGVALDLKLRGQDQRVYVLMGDGELNEGSVWEAALVAASHRLDNLVVVVDRNGFQANARTEDLIPLEPIADKFRAFGWYAAGVDGHDFNALHDVFSELGGNDGRPRAVIATTVRGRGLRSLEARADRWFCRFSDDEVAAFLGELQGSVAVELNTPGLVVR
jgi:transketolase